MIEVSHLTRSYGRVLAVDDLSFQLEKGEVVGFLGPNGAGKTTTMRMLTGYLPATRAERMMVAGFDVLRQSMEVRRRIGYLPESVPLYRELRVREMMSFQGRLHSIPRQELKKRIPEVLDRVGVLDRERQLVGNLSRGLKQRVGLAVALLPKPEVLILDEPTSGLDPLQRREVRSLIRELADEHTVLLSSHILGEIESICPRVIILQNGRLMADGQQEELVRNMAGAGFVRFEAMVGDAAAAVELMKSLPGVEEVRECGKLGIHHQFEVRGDGDLREDLGALAMARSWAVRELSWARPTLEELFTRLVLGDDEPSLAAERARRDAEEGGPANEGASARAGDAPAAGSTIEAGASETPAAPSSATFGSASLPLAQDSGDPPLGTPGRKKIIYSLNPFDQGASRELGKPMEVAPPPVVDVELSNAAPGESCEAEDEPSKD